MRTLKGKSKLIGMLLAVVGLTVNTTYLCAQTAGKQKQASETKASETEVASKKGEGGTVTIAAVNGGGAAGHIARWLDSNTLETSIISQENSKIGIGTTSPTSKLTVNGRVESLSGGFRFPDDSTQTTAFKIPLFIVDSAAENYAIIVGSNNSTGIGVQGIASQGTGVEGNSLTGDGVRGNSQDGTAIRGVSTNGTGVFGLSGGGNGVAAVEGNSFSVGGQGVYGSSPQGVGVLGSSTVGSGVDGISTDGRGVSGSSTNGAAVYGQTFGGASSALAGQFDGNVQVTGTLTKGGGSFKIDHPLDPGNKYLYHSFVESPDMMNIYNGNATLDANGEAVVDLPDWYGALNRDARYLLTAIGAPGPSLYIAQKIANNRFKIAGGQPGMEVSWQVTGIRQDAWANKHRIPVEEQKSDTERGFYLHPELFNQPEEKGVEWARHPELMRSMKEERERMKQRAQQ